MTHIVIKIWKRDLKNGMELIHLLFHLIILIRLSRRRYIHRKDVLKETKPSSSEPVQIVPSRWRGSPPSSHPNNGAGGPLAYRRPFSGIMHPITNFEDTLRTAPDPSFQPTPEDERSVNQVITRTPHMIGVGDWISELESEGDSMEVATSHEVRPLPEDFLVPHSAPLRPIITPRTVAITTEPIIHRPTPLGEGPSSPVALPSLDVSNLGKLRWERMMKTIGVMRDEMEELKADNKKLKEELLSKDRRIIQLEKGLANTMESVALWKDMTRVMGNKLMEWEKKNTT